MRLFTLASLSTIALLVPSTVATSLIINDEPTKARPPPTTLITAKPLANLIPRAEPNRFTNPNDFTYNDDKWPITVKEYDELERAIIYYEVICTNKKNGDARHWCYKVDLFCWNHWKALWLNRKTDINCSYKKAPAGKEFDMCVDWTKKHPEQAWTHFDVGGPWRCPIVEKVEAEDRH